MPDEKITQAHVAETGESAVYYDKKFDELREGKITAQGPAPDVLADERQRLLHLLKPG